MKENNIEEKRNKIENLERERIAYLEVDDKAGARRKQKQIRELEFEIESFEIQKVKEELKAYKKVVREYPEIQRRVKALLSEEDESWKIV